MNDKWSAEDVSRLTDMLEDGKTYGEMAVALNRSDRSIGAKIAQLRGRAYRAYTPGPRPGAGFAPAFQPPPARPNDDLKHLRLVLRADGDGSPVGCGFPVCRGGR